MYLLDTNVCIDFLGARNDALTARMDDHFGRLTISTITAAELLVGAKSSESPKNDERQVNAFIASVNIAPFDLTAAQCYGEIIRDIGVKRKSVDRLIRVQAVALGLTLVTRNEKHFADVPGLKVENWTA